MHDAFPVVRRGAIWRVDTTRGPIDCLSVDDANLIAGFDTTMRASDSDRITALLTTLRRYSPCDAALALLYNAGTMQASAASWLQMPQP